MERKLYRTQTNNNCNLYLFETNGFSMWPFLNAEERLIIKKTSIEDLRVGDIILYRSDNQLVCHRLVRKVKEKERYLLYARGDNSFSAPELVRQERLFGRAIGIIKNGKMLSLTGRKQQFINRFIVLIAPLVCIGIKIANLFYKQNKV